jgi:hypothetical protein
MYTESSQAHISYKYHIPTINTYVTSHINFSKYHPRTTGASERKLKGNIGPYIYTAEYNAATKPFQCPHEP